MKKATTYVKYNGKDLTFGGVQTAPFVSQTNEYVQVGGGVWVILKKITLTGTLTGCGQSELIGLVNQVRAIFEEDFHTLAIKGVDSIPCIKVVELDFGESRLLSNIDYTISLQAYDQDSFATVYKVIDPSERIEFSQSDNFTMQKVITISAKGISCGNNDALANARSFVEGQFTKRLKDKPGLISSIDGHESDGYLASVAEEINRIEGTYALVKTFMSDLGGTALPADFNAGIILRYVKELGQQRGEYAVINYEGTVNYGIDNQEASTAAHSKIEAFVKVNRKDGYRLLGLDINEDKFGGIITFSFQYTEDNIDVVDDWDVTLSEGSNSSLIKVSVNGLVTAKGPLECRWEKVATYFGTDAVAKKRYYGIASSYYNDYGTPAFQNAIKKNADQVPIALNAACVDFQVSKEEKNGEISYSFSFDNRISYGYYSFDYSINIGPSIWKIAASPSIKGNWVMLDLGYRTRARFDIHGQFVAGEGAPKQNPGVFAKNKYIEYCAPTTKEWYELEEATILKGANARVGDNFAYGWSFLAPHGVTAGPGTTSIVDGEVVAGDAAGSYVTPHKKGLIIKQG